VHRKKNSNLNWKLNLFLIFTFYRTSNLPLFFSCDSDYVILSGGEQSEKFCGQKLPREYISKDNVVGVRFVSNSHENQQKPGFVATYTSGLAGTCSI